MSLNIVGDGTDRENLQNLAKRLGVNVNFIGKIDPKEIYKYYEDADVFVSLNPHEPYGIVYLEALEVIRLYCVLQLVGRWIH